MNRFLALAICTISIAPICTSQVHVRILKPVLMAGEQTEVVVTVSNPDPDCAVYVYGVNTDGLVQFKDTMIVLTSQLVYESIVTFSLPIRALVNAIWGEYQIVSELMDNHTPSIISGYKFYDINRNGSWEGYPPIPGNEPGLSGVEIILSGPHSQTTVTDNKGYFKFIVTVPGTYTLSESIPAGWMPTTRSSYVFDLRLFKGETVPVFIFGNTTVKTDSAEISYEIPCSCNISTMWKAEPQMRVWLEYPRNPTKIKFGKGIVLRANGFDADKLILTCETKNSHTGFSYCTDSDYLVLPARIKINWKLRETRWLNKSDLAFGADRPQAEFRNGRDEYIGKTAEGQEIRLYPPFLEWDYILSKGEEATVYVSLNVEDDDPSKELDDIGDPVDIAITFRRESPDHYYITTSSVEPPLIPDMGYFNGASDCPCQIDIRWENPFPIESSITGEYAEDIGEQFRLSAELNDIDRLVVWCTGSRCEGDVRQFELNDVVTAKWSANDGYFSPDFVKRTADVVSNKGNHVYLEAPTKSGETILKLDASDSGFQFQDATPKQLSASIKSKEHGVMFVPGFMGSELYYGEQMVWPPTSTTLGTNFGHNWGSMELKEDGTQNLLTTGKVIMNLMDKELYGRIGEVMKQHGYELSYCPYDWRLDLQTKSSIVFDEMFNKILEATGKNEMTIICHSMGGLLSRSWLTQNPQKQQSIDKVFFMGTPHHGAPQAYKWLRFGSTYLFETFDYFMYFLFGDAMPVLSDNNLQKTLQNWPAAYILLPTHEWFNNAGWVFADQKSHSIGDLNNSSEGPITSLHSTYFTDHNDIDDTWLPNGELVQNAIRFHNQVKKTPTDMDLYNIITKDVDTEEIYILEGPSLTALIGNVPGIGFASKLVSIGLNNLYEGCSYDTKGQFRCYTCYGSGDGTVPTASAEWRWGKVSWKYQYQLSKIKHSDIPSNQNALDFIIYTMESLSR